MKFQRKVVQHGPCTLTVSLPKAWTNRHNIQRGDHLSVQHMNNGLFITSGMPAQKPPTQVDLSNRTTLMAKTIGSLYRIGHNEITVKYATTQDLETLHGIVGAKYIGFEIVDETNESITIKKVSNPDEHEFDTLFRRIFHFLTVIGEDSYAAATTGDTEAYERLIGRDRNVDRLADFCRRVVGQQGQSTYRNDCALYHVVEQLEKIGDLYRDINKRLLSSGETLTGEELSLYAEANRLMRAFGRLFFAFDMEKVRVFYEDFDVFKELSDEVEEQTGHGRITHLIEQIPRELHNLIGSVLMLNL